MSVLAIFPARGGSKRIKNKNIIDFCGRKMIEYPITAAKHSNLFDEIHVSTDSKIIGNVVQRAGVKIEFFRPKHLSDDLTGTIPVLKWVLEKYKSIGKKFDDIFNIMPASPFLKKEDLVAAYNIYCSHDRKHPLHVVAEFPAPIEWAFRRENNGKLVPVNKGGYAIRSQDLQKAYYETGPFSIFHSSHILNKKPVTDEGFLSYVIPKDRAIDIDDHEDLKLAEKIFIATNI